ncbi:ubiquinone biosynthesis O-methyltransferase [Biscogniauxia mediterranea]|nr:ubiquinone biosynthesis O-methyltransferase [Biscogniauxia mediterranea]
MPPPLRLPHGSWLATSTRGGAHAPRVTPKSTPNHHPSSRRAFVASPSRPLSPPSPSPSTDSHPSSSSPHFTTVSPDEVSHFNALASSWWDPHGPSRILHLMNPLRHDFIRSCRASVSSSSSEEQPTTSGITYLDVGCGGGIFAESAARLRDTSRVTGIDPSGAVIGVARSHARRDPALMRGGKLRYVQTSIEGLSEATKTTPGEATTYDVVTVFEVIEHVAAPAAFLDRCAPLVRPGGWLVLSTMARTWAAWLTTVLVAEDLLRVVPRGTHDWRKYLDERELREYFLNRRQQGGGGGGSGGGYYWTEPRCMGVVYVPGLGWKVVPGSEKIGNYFFAVRRALDS